MAVTKNTGKSSEDIFERWIENLGAFVYRFEDLFDAKRKGKVANRKPSDFLVTLNGETSYAEVKSTIKPTFTFANIRPEQWRVAVKQTRAGGTYYFYVHFIGHNRWFKLPARLIIDSAKKSINIKELGEYEISVVS